MTFQYHFTDLGAFKPYVGIGGNYTYFYENELANGTLNIKDNSWGGALQVGADYMVNKNWSLNLDVKYVWMDTDVRLTSTGATLGTLDIDPWLHRHRRALPLLTLRGQPRRAQACAPQHPARRDAGPFPLAHRK